MLDAVNVSMRFCLGTIFRATVQRGHRSKINISQCSALHRNKCIVRQTQHDTVLPAIVRYLTIYKVDRFYTYSDDNNTYCFNRWKNFKFYSYEERWRSLDMIMKNYKHSSTFEEFISNVYSPVQTTSPFQQQPYLRSNSGICVTEVIDNNVYEYTFPGIL